MKFGHPNKHAKQIKKKKLHYRAATSVPKYFNDSDPKRFFFLCYIQIMTATILNANDKKKLAKRNYRLIRCTTDWVFFFSFGLHLSNSFLCRAALLFQPQFLRLFRRIKINAPNTHSQSFLLGFFAVNKKDRNFIRRTLTEILKIHQQQQQPQQQQPNPSKSSYLGKEQQIKVKNQLLTKISRFAALNL